MAYINLWNTDRLLLITEGRKLTVRSIINEGPLTLDKLSLINPICESFLHTTVRTQHCFCSIFFFQTSDFLYPLQPVSPFPVQRGQETIEFTGRSGTIFRDEGRLLLSSCGAIVLKHRMCRFSFKWLLPDFISCVSSYIPYFLNLILNLNNVGIKIIRAWLCGR